MYLHPGRSSIRVECTTCLARINEECADLPAHPADPTWRRQPSVDELRTFVEAAASNVADPYWIQRRAREIMGT